eukprot:TRINITY_DN8636_c0_g1_i1.p1 TRINITY_DN8636_c0_g1~~TRINITY_DN8636_c0_g1_i1.p1  ORF type:complete len:291 (+),score=60.17 TRINITY_DN8636_c0_g1_i1:76-948(+)
MQATLDHALPPIRTTAHSPHALRVLCRVGLRTDDRFLTQHHLTAHLSARSVILATPRSALVHHLHHLRKAIVRTAAAIVWIPFVDPWDAPLHQPSLELEQLCTEPLFRWPTPLLTHTTDATGNHIFRVASNGIRVVACAPIVLDESFCVARWRQALDEAIKSSESPMEDVAIIVPDMHAIEHAVGLPKVVSWLRDLKACTRREKNAADVIATFTFPEGCESSLYQYSQEVADIFVDVSGLETGYSRDVHGQMIVTQREELATSQKVYHYKLGETNSSFFPPGTRDLSTAV